MDHVDIRIHRLGDPPIEDLAVIDQEGRLAESPQDIEPIVTLIEKGTAEGRAKVGVFIPFRRDRVRGDGSILAGDVAYLYREMTLRNWAMVTAAAAGMVPQEFEGGIFDALAIRARSEKALGILTPLIEDLDDGPLAKAVAAAVVTLLGFEEEDLAHVTPEDIEDAVARAAETMRDPGVTDA